MLTGVTFVAFASGFSVCLFDIQQVDACVALSNHWLDKFIEFGTHIITWFIELLKASIRYYQ